MTTTEGRRHRTLEERTALYDRVNELRSRGAEIAEIATELGMSRRDVSYWLRVKRPCRATYVPDLTPGPDLAYLVGAYLGDGRTAGEQDKKVRFNLADLEFANLLNPIVARILRTEPKPVKMEAGFYCVNYDSAVLYDYLQGELASQMSVIDLSPGKFVRGFFDAEGYVTQTIHETERTPTSVTVGAANCSLEYLGLVRKLLSDLGIHSKLRMTNKAGQPMLVRGRRYFRRRDVYHLEINNFSAVKTYQERVDFSIPQKKRKLQDLVAIVSSLDPSQRYEWFTSRYVKLGHRLTRKDHTAASNINHDQELN